MLLIGCLCALGDWFVHHPRAWLREKENRWPSVAVAILYSFGNPTGDITDALGWTGHDVVHEYDEEAPAGAVARAGYPVRKSAPAPDDIRIIERGEFTIGWSDSLRHPAWCAYHVTRDRLFEDGNRPSFLVDRAIPSAPRPDDYTNSGYDRGHMAPNHAIVSRYGVTEQRKTFLMSNITPQSAPINRGVWRDFEHRIADLWTARYGEIWVIVGTIPSRTGQTTGTQRIDVPDAFFQLVLAQEGMDVRALAILIPHDTDWGAWAARHIVTIDELEAATGYDFNADFPAFFQDYLEAERPTRLWPVRFRDIFSQILLRFR